MKRFLFAFLTVFMAMSCNKVAPDDAGDLIDVNFNVSTMSVTNEPITRASTPAADILKMIYYRITASDGTEVKSGYQYEGDGFGTISARIPAGSYSVVFWGSLSDAGGYMKTDNDLQTNGADIFYYGATITISESTKTVDIVLARQTGRVTVEILDTKPADVGQIKIEFYGNNIWTIGTTSYSMQDGSFTDQPGPNAAGGYDPIWHAFFPTGNAYANVIITLYDPSGHEMGSVNVPVDIYQNRNTIVRGNLFDAVMGRSFQILVNDEWGDDNVVTIG